MTPASLQIAWQGGGERLAPKVMLALIVLSRSKGDTVSRTAFVDQCWEGRIVGDDAVNRIIAQLRRVGEKSGGAFTIETIPRVGFRLIAQPIADAHQIAQHVRDAPASPVREHAASRRLRRLPTRPLLIGGAFIGVALAILTTIASMNDLPFTSRAIEKAVPLASAPLWASRLDPAARRAAEELEQSRAPGDREAASLIRKGELDQAFDVLEALARDLEQTGDRRAASQAYSRLAALAFITDPGRGLATRRKAFVLDPTSTAAVHGLLFDTILLKGPAEAILLSDEILADPSVGVEARGWALAIRAVGQIDFGADESVGREAIDSLISFGEESGSAKTIAVASWPTALWNWRADRLEQAMVDINSAPLEIQHTVDVVRARVLFSAGDWIHAQSISASVLDQRRARGHFLPWPLFETACFAGLFTRQEAASIQYCDVLSGQQIDSIATPRVFAALAAAARSDHELATRELDAAAALMDPADAENFARYHLAEIYVAGRRRDIVDAARAERDYEQLVAKYRILARQSASRNATAARVLGDIAIEAGDNEIACREYSDARERYAKIGAEAGVIQMDHSVARHDCD